MNKKITIEFDTDKRLEELKEKFGVHIRWLREDIDKIEAEIQELELDDYDVASRLYDLVDEISSDFDFIKNRVYQVDELNCMWRNNDD